MFITKKVYFDEGDGGFDPSTSPAPSRTQAKYETQLPKEFQGDDFAGIEDLGKLYTSYKSLKAESSGKERMPGKDSTPEEIKAFYGKLGYPEKAEDYNLSDYGKKPDDIADQKRVFLEEAHKNYLSKGQANALWKSHLASIDAEAEKQRKAAEAKAAAYPERLDSYLRETYPDDTKRRQRIETEKNIISEFSAASGLGTKLSEAGLTTDPEFMHALASWYEKVSPQSINRSRGIPEGDADFTQFYTSM